MLDSDPGEHHINIRSVTLPPVEKTGIGVDLESLISPGLWEEFTRIASQQYPQSPDAQITLTANLRAAFPEKTALVSANETSLLRVKNWVADAYAIGEVEDCADRLYDLMPLILGKEKPPKLKKLMETAILERVNARYYAMSEHVKLILCLRHLYPHLYQLVKTVPTVEQLQRGVIEMESQYHVNERNYASFMAMTRLYVGEAEWGKFKINNQHIDSLKKLIQLYTDKGNYHGIAEIAKNLAIIAAEKTSIDEQGLNIYRAPKQESKIALPVVKAA